MHIFFEEPMMSTSLLFVESTPEPGKLDEYHRWHDEIHVPEMLGISGFVSARRWRTDGDSFVTLYTIDTDVETAKANLKSAFASGKMSPPVAVRTDIPALMRYLSLISEASM
jgi:hypothetical protein